MTNEIIFFVTAIIDLVAVLCLLRMFGKAGPILAIAINIILISTFGAKLISLFGFVTNVGNVFYATVFAATMLLTEHYGKGVAYKSIWISFAGLILFIFMGQLTIRAIGVPDTLNVDIAMNTLFHVAFRVALASASAYILSQHLAISIFSRLFEYYHGGKLWLRVIVSASFGQLLDSIVFFSIAFAGELGGITLIQVIFVGMGAKIIVALISIPFIYKSYAYKPKQEDGFLSPVVF
ncbi:MAG: queuosine precursor transporter [Candidatus Sungbacteria bacterium]|nr:queuosine precursor transporter [Candidatus Sungbacteria bacterium]